jgi:SAM-dependent methyltransferase
MAQWEQFRAVNQRNWNARVALHVAKTSRYAHDVAMAKAGKPALQPTEVKELAGIVTADSTVLHLQCHIGTDTLSLKHFGARKVVGLDFSAPALAAAQQLARDAGVPDEDARWVESDVYDAAAALGGEQFDVVYVSVGSLCWLPDIDLWAAVVGACLKPGGHFYIRDMHPMASTLASDEACPGYMERPRDAHGARELLMVYPYFQTRHPTTFESETSYADNARLGDPGAHVTHEWNHPLGAVITALIVRGGLQLEFCHEHRDIDWQFQDHMQQREEHHGRFGGWELPPHLADRVPLMYSLRARKPLPPPTPRAQSSPK